MLKKRKMKAGGNTRNSRKNANGRRRFYGDARRIANGLLNRHFYSATVPDQCLLRYHNGRFLFLVPVRISRASLRRFIIDHIQRLNVHPSARSDPEQQISATPAKIRSVLLAVQRAVEL